MTESPDPLDTQPTRFGRVKGAAAKLPNPGRSNRKAVRAAWKAIILVVGVTIIAAGVAMLVLPGPGIVVIILGLAVLASEFVWARALLEKAKDQAERAKDKAAQKLDRRRAKRAGRTSSV